MISTIFTCGIMALELKETLRDGETINQKIKILL